MMSSRDTARECVIMSTQDNQSQTESDKNEILQFFSQLQNACRTAEGMLTDVAQEFQTFSDLTNEVHSSIVRLNRLSAQLPQRLGQQSTDIHDFEQYILELDSENELYLQILEKSTISWNKMLDMIEMIQEQNLTEEIFTKKIESINRYIKSDIQIKEQQLIDIKGIKDTLKDRIVSSLPIIQPINSSIDLIRGEYFVNSHSEAMPSSNVMANQRSLLSTPIPFLCEEDDDDDDEDN